MSIFLTKRFEALLPLKVDWKLGCCLLLQHTPYRREEFGWLRQPSDKIHTFYFGLGLREV